MDRTMTEKNVCLLFAAMYFAEMITALRLTGDVTVVPIALCVLIFSFFANQPLSNPSNMVSLNEALESSLSSLVLVVAGLVILFFGIRSWFIACSIAMAYGIGNRIRSSGIVTIPA
jgi:hypothetical protein